MPHHACDLLLCGVPRASRCTLYLRGRILEHRDIPLARDLYQRATHFSDTHRRFLILSEKKFFKRHAIRLVLTKYAHNSACDSGESFTEIIIRGGFDAVGEKKCLSAPSLFEYGNTAPPIPRIDG